MQKSGSKLSLVGNAHGWQCKFLTACAPAGQMLSCPEQGSQGIMMCAKSLPTLKTHHLCKPSKSDLLMHGTLNSLWIWPCAAIIITIVYKLKSSSKAHQYLATACMCRMWGSAAEPACLLHCVAHWQTGQSSQSGHGHHCRCGQGHSKELNVYIDS